jgi:hypothetical protein
MEQQQRPPGIARIAAKYGLIQGVLSFALNAVGTLANLQPTWLVGVFQAVLLIVLMVLAHREFKKTHNGIMMYSEGLGSGTLLSVAGAVVTAVLLYIYVRYINTTYLSTLIQAQHAALEQRGITGPQAQQAMAMVGAVMTPVGIAVSSLISGAVVGFIVALIVSIFTQKPTHRP